MSEHKNRTIDDAIRNAERIKKEFPILIQPSESDKDLILLLERVKELEQQVKTLQGNWDRCFNSRAEYIRDNAMLEQQINEMERKTMWIYFPDPLDNTHENEALVYTTKSHALMYRSESDIKEVVFANPPSEDNV